MATICQTEKARLKPRVCHRVLWLACCIVLCSALLAEARINVVTLPDREATQLTIYNSVDLTLVKETRLLTFRKGLNRLEFSWANTLIDPTSVEFHALSHVDAIDVLDVSFPPRVSNTLEWRIQSDFAGEVQVEIRYFTSGISWSADYVLEADKVEKRAELAGSVRVNNNSGEDYENAQVRLVVGVIRLVEDIATLARAGHPRSEPMTRALKDRETLSDQLYGRLGRFGGDARGGLEPQKAKEIVKEGLSEYFLYTVEGRDTIPNGWSKRLPSFKAADVPIRSYYKYEREQWDTRVMRYYQFTNSIPSKLGTEPLPDGAVNVFRLVTADNLHAFVGRTSVKYIPIQESVELELGNDLEVLVRPVLLNWEKTNLKFDQNGNVTGWTLKERWQVEVQNSKDIDVVLDIRRNFAGDWSLQTATPYEKIDAGKVKFLVPLQAREKKEFTYEVMTQYGVNVTR